MPNYRQQTTTSLGTSTACPSCTPTFSQLTLCFAATENTLCCGTSTQSIVYVGYQANPTLANVTGLLYSNNTLTTQATAGFYSDDAGITCSSSTLISLNTSSGNQTGYCLAPQATPLYFYRAAGATNESPLVNDEVFSDAEAIIPLNNTSTIMYYMTSLTAYGVQLGKVVSIAQCTTPPQ